MSDINGIMNIAGQALMTQQQAISVTSHNIANVNTPGYSRQRLVYDNEYVVEFCDQARWAMGSAGTAIQRIYDRFIGNAQINQ